MPLDPGLASTTHPLLALPAATLLLADDTRWPWLILVPRDDSATELHHLSPEERHAFVDVVTATAAALERATGCAGINVAMIGNVVAQLHCHVVARSPDDPNWPGPIWGFGAAVPYGADTLPAFAATVRDALRDRI